MLDRTDARRRLLRLFRRTPVADLEALENVLHTPSRTTIFRILSEIGYFTSYSHAGRFYTLGDIPSFDDEGLWSHGDVLFSRHRSLRATVLRFVEDAPAGQTHSELEARLRLRVHDTCLDLVESMEIGRTSLQGLYLYVSATGRKAKAQIARRREEFEREGVERREKPASAVVIEVLLEIIHGAKVDVEPSEIAARLATRGVSVAAAQVEALLREHGLKKTAESHSRRSRR
jgi:hypothetical protein